MKSDTMGHHLTTLAIALALLMAPTPSWSQMASSADLTAKSGFAATEADEKLNYTATESISFRLETPKLNSRGEPLSHYKFRLLHSLKLLKASGLDIKMLTLKAAFNMRALEKEELSEPIRIIRYLNKTTSYSFIDAKWGTELSGEFRKDGFVHNAWELEMLKLLRLKEAILQSQLIRSRQIEVVVNTTAKEEGNLEYDISLEMPEYILEKTVRETIFAEQLDKELNGIFDHVKFTSFRKVGFNAPTKEKRKLEFYFTHDEASFNKEDKDAFALEVKPVIDFLRAQGQVQKIELRYETNTSYKHWKQDSSFGYDGHDLQLEYLLNGRKNALSIQAGSIDVLRQELLNMIVLRRSLAINSEDNVRMHLLNVENKQENRNKVIVYLKE